MRYHFDRSKPFYPLVMSYLLQLHAIKEFAAIGTLGPRRTWQLAQEIEEAEREGLQRSVTKLLGPMSLAITDETDRLDVPVEFVAKEFVDSHAYLLRHQVLAALSVLVMAHEITKEKRYRTVDEKCEFLRHCRNAAAHNGCWSFKHDEPRRPARWRSISLDPSLQGLPLLKGPDFTGSLSLGDPIALLWDIEHDNPAMHV